LNPYRDPALRLEVGERALSELMSRADWQEIIGRYVAMELGPYLDGPGDPRRVEEAALREGLF